MFIPASIDQKITRMQVAVLVKKDVVTNVVKANSRRERAIRKSQKKLAETTLVPGYTKIYA